MSGAVRVLVVGAGRAGMVHARNLAAGVPGGRLAGVADPSPAAREQAVAELGDVAAHDDPVAAVTRDDVDAVVIASPTFTHADVAIAALDAGRHVLCEKPLASTLAEAGRIAAAERASSATLLMGFMRRFDTGFRRVAERIAAGDIGAPLLVKSTGRGPGLPPPWAWDSARSGGLVAEVNSHDLDTVRWMSGQEPVRVHAVGRAAKRPDLAERHPGFVDLVALTMELSGGGLGMVDGACPADYGYDARVEVYGSDGVLFAGDPRRGSTLLVGRDGAAMDVVASWRDLFADAYRAEDRHLVAVARGAAQPRTTVDDGVQALRAVVAANRSMERGVPVAVTGEDG
ncbi:MAG TPA: Gfo/Idh/MocA family oxidoreductase [Euzebyales bacterium]|nr:Gfo/Idh/MocA family oxidoreductase [Euzebyales bacterium]